MDHWQQIQTLIREMYKATPEEAQAICRRLLQKTLADGLNATAWDVLEAVADMDSLWSWSELPTLLGQYKLPTDREALQKACQSHAGTQRFDMS